MDSRLRTKYDADLYAVRLLSGLAIDPSAYIAYLSSLSDREDISSLENLDKTHPPLRKRLELLKENAPQGIPGMKTTEAFLSFKRIIDACEVKK